MKNNTFDENFVSPRTLTWLYKMVVENDIDVTIKPCKDVGMEGMVDITISKSADNGSHRRLNYSTTIRDFVVTKHPFINQHNAIRSIVSFVEKLKSDMDAESERIENIVKKEHE